MFTQRLYNPRLQYRYNAAVWHREEDARTVLIAREVFQGGGTNEPDKGNMVLMELDRRGRIVHEDTVWQVTEAEHLLEDPRALVLPDGRVVLGLTAVASDGKPYPAVATLDTKVFRTKFPKAHVLGNLTSGKNTTPIRNNIFFYRPESEHHNHKLVEFAWDGQKAQGLSEITFPREIPWASWRMGTTMPPIWINDQEALMIIHGIRLVNGKFIYSLGRAKLSRSGNSFSQGVYQVEVDPQPILTPDDFLNADGSPMFEELHQTRRVVYACGGVMKKRYGKLILALFVNVGDRQTVEVHFPWKSLISGWWKN